MWSIYTSSVLTCIPLGSVYGLFWACNPDCNLGSCQDRMLYQVMCRYLGAMTWDYTCMHWLHRRREYICLMHEIIKVTQAFLSFGAFNSFGMMMHKSTCFVPYLLCPCRRSLDHLPATGLKAWAIMSSSPWNLSGLKNLISPALSCRRVGFTVALKLSIALNSCACVWAFVIVAHGLSIP